MSEDGPMLRGSGIYTEDLPLPHGCLHAAFVRSNDAHGDLVSIDVSEAASLPGVVAVLTCDDLDVEPFSYFPELPLAEHMRRSVLASGRVRFVGEPVALVLAESREAALDAAEMVVVETDPLPAVASVDVARSANAQLVHTAAGTNVLVQLRDRSIDPLIDAAVVAAVEVDNPRLISAPLETSGIVVVPGQQAGAGDILDVWCTSQGPQGPRDHLARALGLPPERVRVRSPLVGGGFGGRGGALFEFFSIAAAALALGRPIRWIESRSELFFSMPHGRGQHHNLRIGFDTDGTITGLDAEMWCDTGAYPHMAALLAGASRRQCTGMYRVPEFSYRYGAAVTNTPGVGAYRGAGQPEVTAAIERAMDVGAELLDIDPIELRLRNLIRPEELPYETGTGITIDSGDPGYVLRHAAEIADVAGWRQEQDARRNADATCQIGIGVSCYAQTAGSGGEADAAQLELGSDGSVLISCGSQGHGQGHHSLWAALVAERVGVAIDVVRIQDGDTRAVPESQTTGGSRTAQLLGGQVAAGADVLLERAKLAAARLLEADPLDLVASENGIAVAGVPARLVSWPEVAAESDDPITVTVDVPGSGPTHPYGTHISVVEVDVETGEVRLLSHLAADDCGVVLNEESTIAQQHGGAVSGISQALFEVAQWDEDGTPRTVTFADYLIPAASDLPFIDTVRIGLPTDRNALGVRGIGENGAIGSPPAVQNAVVDALRHLGVHHIDVPLTPQRVWEALRA